jgi:biotin operon repressor
MYDQLITNIPNHQKPALVDMNTGEILSMPNKRPNNLPNGKQFYDTKEEFYKGYVKADNVLLSLLTPLEYRVVSIMRMKSKMNTNSLDPLSDESSLTDIATQLNIHRNSVNKIISRLRELGIFATFEVTNQYGQRIKSWILNPVISFKGKTISTEIIGLFSDTMITKLVSK